jgi:DNA-binding NarL/FixJ family response regulator
MPLDATSAPEQTDVRVLIVDDHEVVRQGLRALLGSETGFAVCGEAKTGREAVRKARSLHPDIVVLDVSMPELNGIDAIRQIREGAPKCEVLILTMHDRDDLLRTALQVGARGYVLKTDAASELIAAIRAIGRGKVFLSSGVAGSVVETFLSASGGAPDLTRGRLTARERELVQLLAEGMSNKEAATALHIAVKTVETHRTNILKKLGFHSVAELVRYAVRNRIVEA